MKLLKDYYIINITNILKHIKLFSSLFNQIYYHLLIIIINMDNIINILINIINIIIIIVIIKIITIINIKINI